MIFEYVRDKHGHKRGVVCAIGRDYIGWSLCNRSMGDRFNKELGLKIAEGRASKVYIINDPREWSETIPPSAWPSFKRMIERAKKYFK
jgi:hypothetical protein